MPYNAFVSSTCYDLVDLRAELEVHLRDLGCTPIMSDRLTSEFEVDPKSDSIETCLVNVRAADVVLIVLSQRYGPRLGKCGFEDVSATHLEYRAAIKAEIPVFFYVRDRLLADYNNWRTAGVQTPRSFAWVKSERDDGLFEFLREHEELKAGESKNWMWTFADSVQLKGRVAHDLKAQSSRALLQRLADSGRLPWFIATTTNRQSQQAGNGGVNVSFGNESDFPVSDAVMTIEEEPSRQQLLGTFSPRQHQSTGVLFPISHHAPTTRTIRLSYQTHLGHRVEDDFLLNVAGDGIARIWHMDKRLNEVSNWGGPRRPYVF